MTCPGTIEIHRPGRVTTPPPAPKPVPLHAPPPSPVEAGAGGSFLSPVASSLSIVVFAIMTGGKRYLAVAAILATLAMGAAIATRRARTRETVRLQQVTRARYLGHLSRAEQSLAEAAVSQRRRATHDHPDIEELTRIVDDRTRVWERLTHHPDFAVVRIGSGPIRPDLYPTGSTQWNDGAADPELLGLARRLERKWNAVDSLPIVVDLRTVACLTIVGDRPMSLDLARSIITRLAIAHSPDDLSIDVRTDGSDDLWDWIKWLPHSRVKRAGSERAILSNGTHSSEPPRTPKRVMVMDGCRPGSALSADVEAMLESEDGADTIVVALVEQPHETPTSTDAIVSVTDRSAVFTQLDSSSEVVGDIVPDQIDHSTAERIARSLAPLRLARGRHDLGSETVSLTDLLQLDSTAPDVVAHRASTLPGRSPIGTDTAGRPLWLDLREAAAGGMGPHGMLVGATGSGKSELLRTLVTGLALGASSDDLTFVFIDFKGGATFSGLDRLPHTAGVVTNLESSESLVDRVRLGLDFEMRRRQALLRKAGADRVDEYRHLLVRNPSLEPLPDLLIVVDEFAELLTAHPGLEETFASIGRTGRSLGVRLLLSGQRIDEGRLRRLEAHLRFRICLKTFTPEESIAVLGSRASFDLPPEPGHGHLWFDGSLTRFRVVLTHSRPPEPAPIPSGFEVVEMGGPRPEQRTTMREQTATLVARLARLDQPSRRIWLDPLPERLTIPVAPDRPLRAVIGLTDRPATREQVPAVIDFTEGSGHLGIVGMPGSGASTLMSTIICSLASWHSPHDLAIHIVAPHAGLDGRVADLPHVRSTIGRGGGGDVRDLLDRLAASSDRRGAAAPARKSEFLFIDGWGSFAREHGPDITDRLSTIAAGGSRSGVHLVVSATRWTEFGSILRNLLTLKFELRLNLPLESEIDRRAAELVPQRLPGGGITASGELTQIALPPRDPAQIGLVGTSTTPHLGHLTAGPGPAHRPGARTAIGATP